MTDNRPLPVRVRAPLPCRMGFHRWRPWMQNTAMKDIDICARWDCSAERVRPRRDARTLHQAADALEKGG